MSAVASGVSGRSAAMVTGMAGVSGRRRYTELRSIPAPRDVRWDHRWPLRLGAPSRESTMLPHSLCSPGLLTARGWTRALVTHGEFLGGVAGHGADVALVRSPTATYCRRRAEPCRARDTSFSRLRPRWG